MQTDVIEFSGAYLVGALGMTWKSFFVLKRKPIQSLLYGVIAVLNTPQFIK